MLPKIEGVVGVLRGLDGRLWLIQPQSENDGKLEMVMGWQPVMRVVEGLEFPGGAVEKFDHKWRKVGIDYRKGALVREVAQEALIWVEPEQIDMLDRTMLVEQIRPGHDEPVQILGYLGVINLTAEQEIWLERLGAKPALEVHSQNIRLRDQAILGMLETQYAVSSSAPTLREERAYV